MTQPDWMYAQTQSGPARPPLRAGFFRIAGVVQGLLVLTILVQVAMMFADVYYLSLAGRLIDTPSRVPLEDIEWFYSVSMLVLLSYVGLWLLTGIAFISWLFKAHRSDRVDRREQHHKSYWAIIGWFVPIMGLFRPYQMVDDTRRGINPLAPVPVFQPLWWAFYLIGFVGDRVVEARWPAWDEPASRAFGEELRTAAWTELCVSLVNIVGAVLAILVVREVTALLRDSPRGRRFD